MAGTALKDVGGETAPSQVIIVVYIKEDYRHIHQTHTASLYSSRLVLEHEVPSNVTHYHGSSKKEKA
jgi:hypothetical protein